MGEACAALARGLPLPAQIADFGLTAAMLSPARLPRTRRRTAGRLSASRRSNSDRNQSDARLQRRSLATETNTFAPMPTGIASFRDRGYFPAGTASRTTCSFSPGRCGRRACAASAKGWT